MKSEYYYAEPGEEPQGPLALESLKIAVSAGRLSEKVALSRDGAAPWLPYRTVIEVGDSAFAMGGKKLAKVVAQTRAAQIEKKYKPRQSVAGFLEVIGWFLVFCGFLAIVLFLLNIGRDGSHLLVAGVAALSNLVSGVMFLAMAEGLTRLGEIATATKRAAERE